MARVHRVGALTPSGCSLDSTGCSLAFSTLQVGAMLRSEELVAKLLPRLAAEDAREDKAIRAIMPEAARIEPRTEEELRREVSSRSSGSSSSSSSSSARSHATTILRPYYYLTPTILLLCYHRMRLL